MLKMIIETGLWSTTVLPPKPHAFIKRELKSSMAYGVPLLDIVTIISSNLASLASSCIRLDMLYQTSGLSTMTLINHIEPIIRAMLEMCTRLATDLNSTGFNYISLSQMHTNLTSHILHNQYLISLLQDNIRHSVGSLDLNQMQDLLTRFSDSSRDLLLLYRDVENTLGIALADSPISS